MQRQVVRTGLIALVAAAVLGASAAPAQGQLVRLVPFCDDVTVGAPASGFRFEGTGSLVGLVVVFRTGSFAGLQFAPVEGALLAGSYPPSVGAATVDVYRDINLNGRVDPGDQLVETINAPDPCAPPVPSSREQCKDGGWRTFRVFRNQGECVSFVAAGDKHPPRA